MGRKRVTESIGRCSEHTRNVRVSEVRQEGGPGQAHCQLRNLPRLPEINFLLLFVATNGLSYSSFYSNLILKGRESESEEREKESLAYFPQIIPATPSDGQDRSQESGTQFRLPMQVVEAQTLKPSSLPPRMRISR